MSDLERKCNGDPGAVYPVVDRRRCEAKGPCVDVCPYDVFELHTVPDDVKRQLGWLTRIKIRAHGGRQAEPVRGDLCQACGLCVDACPPPTAGSAVPCPGPPPLRCVCVPSRWQCLTSRSPTTLVGIDSKPQLNGRSGWSLEIP